jgi:hypothetical protein
VAKSRYWLVIHQPEGCDTIATMKVVGGFATSGPASWAEVSALHDADRYREHGPGSLYVVEQRKPLPLREVSR